MGTVQQAALVARVAEAQSTAAPKGRAEHKKTAAGEAEAAAGEAEAAAAAPAEAANRTVAPKGRAEHRKAAAGEAEASAAAPAEQHEATTSQQSRLIQLLAIMQL